MKNVKKWNHFMLGAVLAAGILSGCNGAGGKEESTAEETVSEDTALSADTVLIEEATDTIHISIDKTKAKCDLTRSMTAADRPVDISYEEVLDILAGKEPGEEVDLRAFALNVSEISEILELTAGQDITLLYNVIVGDLVLSHTDTEVSLSGLQLKEIDGFDLSVFLSLLPELETVEMLDCGYDNDEMAEICEQYEDIFFVWEVVLEHWTFRTDIVAFTSDKTCADTFYMHNEDAKYLKYCKKLMALDLGHNYVNDFSFLEKLTDLRVLIVVDNVLSTRADGSLHHIEDLSVLNNLTEMRYLEIFSNAISDISFLNNMPKLMDVNISYNPIYDASPLFGHPRLRRIWLEHTNIPGGQIEKLRASYPNAKIVSVGEGSIDQGWRANEDYYAMRRCFHENMIDPIFLEE